MYERSKVVDSHYLSVIAVPAETKQFLSLIGASRRGALSFFALVSNFPRSRRGDARSHRRVIAGVARRAAPRFRRQKLFNG